MKKEPLISVIIPVYNVEGYVLRCLKSVSGQSYKKIEILIIDDGSTDSSGKICDEFVRNEKKAQVFHKKNGGLSDARNFGIGKAKGEFIVLVDSDDYVKEEFVTDFYNKISCSGADIAVCGYNGIILEEKIISGTEAAEQLLIKQENADIVAWNKMYKKGLFNNILYPVGKRHEDTLTTYKLYAAAGKVAYMAEDNYVYEEQRAGSIMNLVKNEERLDVRLAAALEACEYFKQNKTLRDAAEVSVLLARFAFIDAAIKGEVGQNCLCKNVKWIKDNWRYLKINPKMTRKLRVYIFLLRFNVYKIARKILFTARV